MVKMYIYRYSSSRNVASSNSKSSHFICNFKSKYKMGTSSSYGTYSPNMKNSLFLLIYFYILNWKLKFILYLYSERWSTWNNVFLPLGPYNEKQFIPTENCTTDIDPRFRSITLSWLACYSLKMIDFLSMYITIVLKYWTRIS